MGNPFKVGSTSHHDFEVMSDLQWHCSKCELDSGQAKTWQVWRQRGIQIDTDEKGRFYKKIYCETCNKKTVFRKLKSLEILEDTSKRSGISSILAKRIKTLYKNEEAIFLRKLPSRELEIDHKFPQIRWKGDETENFDDMSENEIKNKFVLLTRSNNLLKSRYCEKCVKEGRRGHFPGIYYWYEGNEDWNGETEFDEKGCVGCFWYNPYKWRIELNKKVSS